MSEKKHNEMDENLSELIADYVLSCCGKGHFLPYKDYDLIEKWIALSPNQDTLILTLAELVPKYIESGRKKIGRPFSLSGLDRKVIKHLRESAMRAIES